MGGESRGDRERDGFGAPAPPFDLDQTALDAAKSVEHAPMEQFALLSQDRAAGRAVEQAYAEIVFETSHMGAPRGWGHVQPPRRCREAAVARGRVKDEQRVAGR